VRLTETRLRTLIRDLLLEGVREDAAALEVDLKDDPEALGQFQSLSTKPKWVNWLADRYLRKKYPVHDTLPDVLPLVASFASKDAAISQKYGSNEQFSAADNVAFPPESRGWQNPSDVTTMSAADLTQLLALNSREKQRFEVDRSSEAWKSDKIGQFGPWALYFPTTQENSINIAGADPVTLKGYTVWCTARTAGSNLFYNYAGRGIMLFYAIDESKPPTDPKGRISLGFARGELDTSGKYGGITVNAKNNGLKMPDLEGIFGGHLGPILSAAESVIQRHGGSHPATADIKAAASDLVKFEKMLRGLSDEESSDLAYHIMKRDPTAEVLDAAARHKSSRVRVYVAENRNAPPSVLEQLASDSDSKVRHHVAQNRNTPPSALEKLAGDPDLYTQYCVAGNPSTSPSALKKLAGHPDASTRGRVAQNPSASPSALKKLAGHPDASTRERVAQNPSISPKLLEKLAGDPDNKIRAYVALNHNASLSLLQKLAGDRDVGIRRGVADNPNTPSSVLEKLAGDPDPFTRSSVARNHNASLSLLVKLADDSNMYVRAKVARNHNASLSVLQKLAGDPDKDVRSGVANNPNTPLSVLEKLARDRVSIVRHSVTTNDSTPTSVLERLSKDRVGIVRSAAARALAKRPQVRESRRLALKIIAELKRR